MFEEQRISIGLEESLGIILQAYTAINGSFVFRVYLEQTHEYKVIHVSITGKILFKSQ